MRRVSLLLLCLILAVFLSGCVKTYTYQVERKDQDLRGNRGIIMGDVPPDEIGRKRTRTMAGFDVELPPTKQYKTRMEELEREPVKRPVKREAVARIEEPRMEPEEIVEQDWVRKEEPKFEPVREKVSKQIDYTIEKGDTLQKISEKFYGTTRKWPEIYEANKDVLKHPSKIYPGQVIVIPEVKEIEELAEEDIK